MVIPGINEDDLDSSETEDSTSSDDSRRSTTTGIDRTSRSTSSTDNTSDDGGGNDDSRRTTTGIDRSSRSTSSNDSGSGDSTTSDDSRRRTTTGIDRTSRSSSSNDNSGGDGGGSSDGSTPSDNTRRRTTTGIDRTSRSTTDGSDDGDGGENSSQTTSPTSGSGSGGSSTGGDENRRQTTTGVDRTSRSTSANERAPGGNSSQTVTPTRGAGSGGSGRRDEPDRGGNSSKTVTPTPGSGSDGVVGSSQQQREAAKDIAEDQVDRNLQEGLEGVASNPYQDQALALEQRAIEEYAWADDPSDIAIQRNDGQLQAVPSRSAEVEAVTRALQSQYGSQLTAQQAQPQGQSERDRATQALEAQLEQQTGVDLEPGEDFVVEQTGDGRWQARLLPGYGDKQARLTQARQEDDLFSSAVATVEDATGLDAPGEGSVVNEARVEREFADAAGNEQFGDWVINLPGTDRRAEDVLKSGSEWTQETIWQPASGAAGEFAQSPWFGPAGEATDELLGIDENSRRERTIEGAVEGAGAILDPAGLVLTGKEAVEFAGGVGSTQPMRANGETSEFIAGAAGAGALAAAGFTRQASENPYQTGGQVLGSLAGSGAAIRGARAAAGPRTSRAISYGIQPGEELAITAARSGVIPTRVARAVPGVREGQIGGRSFLSDDRGQLDFAGPRSDTATDTDADSSGVPQEMQEELRRMENAVRRRRARERAKERVREQAGEEGPPDPVTVDSQPESQIRTAEGQPDEQIRTADPTRASAASSPTPTQQAAWRSSLIDTGSSGLSSRQRQLAAQRRRDAGDRVPMGDLREVDAGVRGLEARFADQQALSATGEAGAVGGMASAVTFGAQQRLQTAQTPQVTFDEVLRGRPETLVDGATGTGALDLEDDVVASISDFQGNVADTQTRTESVQDTRVDAAVTPTELEGTAQEVASEAQERVAQDQAQELQQELEGRQRQELQEEQDLRVRPEGRTERVTEQRTELRTEFETGFDQWSETRTELESQPQDPWTLGELDDSGWGTPVSESDDRLNPGWLNETFFTIATGGRETPRAPSQEVLEAQPGSLQRTGELPVAFNDQAEADAFADVLQFFDPTPNPDAIGGVDATASAGGEGGDAAWGEWTGWDDESALLDFGDGSEEGWFV